MLYVIDVRLQEFARQECEDIFHRLLAICIPIHKLFSTQNDNNASTLQAPVSRLCIAPLTFLDPPQIRALSKGYSI